MLGAVTFVVGGALVACTGEDVLIPATTPDPTTNDPDATAGDPDATTSPPDGNDDAGTEPGADADTAIDAGGGDGAAPDGGGNSDGGPGPIACNQLEPKARPIKSTCVLSNGLKPPFIPDASGGKFIVGEYELKEITVYEKTPHGTCNAFEEAKHSGNLVLEDAKGGGVTMRYVLANDGGITSRYEQHLAMSGTFGSPAVVTNICPEALATTLEYSSIPGQGVGATLWFKAPYGSKTAHYVWEKPNLQ